MFSHKFLCCFVYFHLFSLVSSSAALYFLIIFCSHCCCCCCCFAYRAFLHCSVLPTLFLSHSISLSFFVYIYILSPLSTDVHDCVQHRYYTHSEPSIQIVIIFWLLFSVCGFVFCVFFASRFFALSFISVSVFRSRDSGRKKTRQSEWAN